MLFCFLFTFSIVEKYIQLNDLNKHLQLLLMVYIIVEQTLYTTKKATDF